MVVSYDGRRAVAASGLLNALSEATVLAAADVRTALTLGRLAGGADEAVHAAVALAVRAVRLGHVYVDLATVATSVAPDDEEVGVDLAGLAWPDGATWPALLAASPLTAVGLHGPLGRPLRLVGSRLYLDRYWRHERAIVDHVRRRSGPIVYAGDRAKLDERLVRLLPDDDGGLQRQAALGTVERHLSVLAGGPGTGKTTTIARILALLHEEAAASGSPAPRVALAAPTGKAAARLADAVHATAAGLATTEAVRNALLATPASTLHRLLGWQPGNRSRFRHHAANPLPHNVVIVDESSMVSLSMMAKLMDAVRPTARLVLAGDPRQLASVEAGAVLGDIVASSLPGIVVLRRVHRYGGAIASVAAAIEAGDPDAVVAALRAAADDVEWIEAEVAPDSARSADLEGVRRTVVDAGASVVSAARAGDGATALAALRSVQVICAHRRGPGGATTWRRGIERWLRAAIAGYGGGPWYVGRPLLVTENDYVLGVFNGDTGVVVDAGGGRLRAVFDRRGELLSVRPTRLASVESLYAMTIHKAQGSQFGSVVVCLPPPASRVLTRELLYTAVTRAQHHLTVIGTEAAVRTAVARPIARASGLAEALATVPASE
ncbi:MAG: exodeoxyribonuclease V subunit alpha [Acidimicrobiia bacterium]